ncbi:MAG: site-specific DNA-methyltransferase [Oscillospiraceae bacterium]|nr:site-specific DNA-methyltransferase [Oscillospiraceae bacterium]
MDKLKLHTPNIADENYRKLAELFPNAVTETVDENGKVVRAIDADVLRQEISVTVVEGSQERYQFTWPDKKKSVVLANQPISKTLRLERDKSVGRDGTVGSIDTDNIYIEGDNLDALKLLQETYLGKVKMIYIDPPYNTGSDAFVYDDAFDVDMSKEESRTDYRDEDGNIMWDKSFKDNPASNGRFHTDWLNMLYPRLRFAKNLLSDDGVIFISIGQDEIYNLQKMMNEVFGEKNFLGLISRQMKSGGGTQGKYFAHNTEYILVYGKKYDAARYFRGKMSEDLIKKVYTQVETEGPRKGEHYRTMGLYQASLGIRPGLRYYIRCPDGSLVIPAGTTFPSIEREGEKAVPVAGDGCWRWDYSKYVEEYKKGNIQFNETSNGVLLDSHGKKSKWNIYTKIWLNDRQEEGTIPTDLIMGFENRHASKEVNSLGIPFDFPKPVGLIKYLIEILNQDNDIIVLDFFSGSATTAHAVMQLNAEDGGHRKFIMVQLPEKCDEKSETFKAGYKNICEIGEERIRRAGRKIKDESPLTTGDLDVGFRVFKVDDSNMKEVSLTPGEYRQEQIEMFADNIKEDRTPEDLLFQVMLDLGILLSSKIEETEIGGKRVYSVADGYMIACFDSEVTEETVTEIAKRKPYYAVFRDSGMASDSVMTNFEQIFETYSPKTNRKVL